MSNKEYMTTNFHRGEFACQQGKCEFCGGMASIDSWLVEGLQLLRNDINDYVYDNCIEDLPAGKNSVGLYISSGVRCIKWNRVPSNMGGPNSDDTSQHVRGTASDILAVPQISIDDMFNIAKNIPMFKKGGIGIYNWGLHLDVRVGQPARWDHRHA